MPIKKHTFIPHRYLGYRVEDYKKQPKYFGRKSNIVYTYIRGIYIYIYIYIIYVYR